MNGVTELIHKSVGLLSFLLGSVIITSCASVPSSSNQALPEMRADHQMAKLAATESVAQNAPTAQVMPSRSQLVKKANISVLVNSVDKSIDIVLQIIEKQQGDLIKLTEQQPKNEYARHTASIQLRVPQNLLEQTLEEIATLGTLKNRSITAEDVGAQLVDFQARLSNLRKTESNLQKIMDRSGSVRDVLDVARELSEVRQTIEQINAQLKNLQNQVAYSTITVNLEATVSSSSPQFSLGSQIYETWNKSTNSFGKFTVGLLKLSIWIMVYSPYLLILAAAGYGFRRWQYSTRPTTPTPKMLDSDEDIGARTTQL